MWLWLIDFQRSYGPFMDIFVCSIPQYLLDGFHSNVMGSYNIKQRFACNNLVIVKFFSSELWPFHEFLCLFCISRTTALISVELQRHDQYEVNMCILQLV